MGRCERGSAVAVVVCVVAGGGIGRVRGNGRTVVEGAGGSDGGGDVDGDVGARGEGGDGAWQRRTTAAADVCDGQVRRRIGSSDERGGGRDCSCGWARYP